MPEKVRLEVRLKPRAKKERVAVTPDGLLDITVTSPPVDNAANDHLVRLLAEKLHCAKSLITIVRGGHSRNKCVEIEGFTKEEIIKKFS